MEPKQGDTGRLYSELTKGRGISEEIDGSCPLGWQKNTFNVYEVSEFLSNIILGR